MTRFSKGSLALTSELRCESSKGSTQPAKLGELIAGAITREIVQLGWPVGESIGSINTLMRRYNVSETVLREAVRQLEQNGLVRPPSGDRAGVFVASPPLDVAAQVLSTYLHLIDVKPAEILGFAAYYTPGMSALAARRIESSAAPRLRAMVHDLDADAPWLDRVVKMQGFFREVAAVTRNSLFEMVSQVLFEAMAPQLMHTESDEAAGRVQHANRAAEAWRGVTEAIIAGDDARIYGAFNWLEAAANYERFSAERRGLARKGLVPAFAPEILNMIDGSTHKQSQLLAFQIAREILESGAMEGAHLGQEPDLLAKYGVGRRVFRQATRILELHQICRMRRGKVGGLIVGQPSGEYAIETAITCIRHAGATADHANEMRRMIEPRLAELLAAERPEVGTDLRTILAAPGPGLERRERFRRRVIGAGGNRLAALICEVLARLDRPSGPAAEAGRQRSAEAVADAIKAGDPALAARHMAEFTGASSGPGRKSGSE